MEGLNPRLRVSRSRSASARGSQLPALGRRKHLGNHCGRNVANH
jgi:hypothetical protein